MEWMQGSEEASRGASAQADQVQNLLNLADELQGTLLPVEPASAYRRRLQGDLLKAQRRQPITAAVAAQQRRNSMLIGAAVGTLASLATLVIALVLRSRHGRLTRMAQGEAK
jgi:hypothetical protein